MDESMESMDSSPSNDTDDDKLLALGANTNSSQNDGLLMPPPLVPPSALPTRLAQSNTPFPSFTSPSREAEVPMEFSPGISRHNEGGTASALEQPSGTSTPVRSNVNNNLESERPMQAGRSEMHPSELFTQSPGSPTSGFKALLDAIDIRESPSGTNDDNFLKRQERPLRRCRSLEMRKRLFDMSNTPPNAFKPVFKRPASVDAGNQNHVHTRVAKRPRELRLCGIKEASTSLLAREEGETRAPVEEPSNTRDSSNHDRIKVAVDALQSPDMIGDCSREHCLPVIPGKHSDLKNINHDTMAYLLNHGFDGKFDKLTVIDCRYPYEYNGGHIRGAINLYTEDDIDKFLKREILEAVGVNRKTHILVFHCEFSSQRGPGLLRHLRKLDRQMNIHQYPLLTFPEMYVLHLGYKEFFIHHPHLCDPSAYIPMADESYINDLKHFRAKAKSWTAGERGGPSKR